MNEQNGVPITPDHLRAAGDALEAAHNELDQLRPLVRSLKDENAALKHEFHAMSELKQRKIDELEGYCATYREYQNEDEAVIKALREQLNSVANDGARANALVSNFKREIADYDQGKDPRDRANMPPPEEVFSRFLEMGELLGIGREKLLASLNASPDEELQPEAEPVPQQKRSLRARLFGRRDRSNGYIDEMTRKEPDAVRPPMMQSVAEDIAGSPLAEPKP